jgi:hypothetical protein
VVSPGFFFGETLCRNFVSPGRISTLRSCMHVNRCST